MTCLYHHLLPSPGSYITVKVYLWMNAESIAVWKPTNHDMPCPPTPTKTRRHQINRKLTQQRRQLHRLATKRHVLCFIRLGWPRSPGPLLRHESVGA